MACLKCGRDTAEGEEFCSECLNTMQRYPVRPGTPVMLPTQERVVPKKVPKRRTVSAEDQIKGLKKRIRTLTALWAVTVLALAVLALIGWREIPRARHRPGQNYTAITATTTPSQEAALVPSEG